MKIEILDVEGTLIEPLELDTNPFRAGEILHLKREGTDDHHMKDLIGEYQVVKVEHHCDVSYSPGYRMHHSVSITVVELETQDI